MKLTLSKYIIVIACSSRVENDWANNTELTDNMLYKSGGIDLYGKP